MYQNKCTKCGAEFETKNPKRVICPNCLYPDKNPIPLKTYSQLILPNDNLQPDEDNFELKNQDVNSSTGSFNHPDAHQQNAGFREPHQDGGYRPHQQSGGFRGQHQDGGYRPHQGGGFREPQQGGGFRRPQQGGGFKRPQQGGGFRRPQQGGGFRWPQQGGGFRRPQQGGGFRWATTGRWI